MPDEDFAERLRVLNERQAAFLGRLHMFDQRDLALLQRLEPLREQVDLLVGDTGQLADTLVEHKSDPRAHASVFGTYLDRALNPARTSLPCWSAARGIHGDRADGHRQLDHPRVPRLGATLKTLGPGPTGPAGLTGPRLLPSVSRHASTDR